MQIICISRGTYSGGKQLAEELANKLGYACLSREELCDEATDQGIPVGKLEMAVLQHRPLGEQLTVEKERFRAFCSATLCEAGTQTGLVYHGRTGHLQLLGVSHVLRVRAIMDPEFRVALTTERLSLSRDKARRYIDEVDEGRQRWVRTMYDTDWEDPENYDVVVNLSQITVGNAAAALVSMAQLPEFQATPAAKRTLSDISLAARCRLAIGDDPRTRGMDVQVKAETGHVLVTYFPRHQRLVPIIPEILRKIAGIEEIICTMASTNLLWIQERFDAKSETLDQVLDIAARWNAAVELVQLVEPSAEVVEPMTGSETVPPSPTEALSPSAKNGGILDDSTPSVENRDEDESTKQTMERLVAMGRAGGHRRVHGGPKDLLDGLDRTVPYSLIVIGDVFLSKDTSVRKRLAREFVGYLSDNLRLPVVGIDELKTRYIFGSRQWLNLLLFGIAATILFGLVFSYQKEVLTFLSREGTPNRIISTICLLVFVPVFAYCYGNFSRYILRLIKFE